jgi:hypothetical protein
MPSLRDALIGAAVALVVTPAAVWWTYDSIMNKITDEVISRLNIELEYPPQASPGYDFSAKCRENERVIGGICYLDDKEKGGSLQNSGISSHNGATEERRYVCNYDRRSAPVQAVAMAACLKPK